MTLEQLVGEWGKYEDWELIHVVEKLERLAAQGRYEMKIRRKKKNAYAKRAERIDQIKAILSDGIVRTTAQIAKAIGLSSSGHLRDILCQMYRDGVIVGFAEGIVAGHYVYNWTIQETIPLPLDNWLTNEQMSEACDGG